MEEDADTLIAEMHRKARFRSLGESIHGTAAKLAVDLHRFQPNTGQGDERTKEAGSFTGSNDESDQRFPVIINLLDH